MVSFYWVSEFNCFILQQIPVSVLSNKNEESVAAINLNTRYGLGNEPSGACLEYDSFKKASMDHKVIFLLGSFAIETFLLLSMDGRG